MNKEMKIIIDFKNKLHDLHAEYTKHLFIIDDLVRKDRDINEELEKMNAVEEKMKMIAEIFEKNGSYNAACYHVAAIEGYKRYLVEYKGFKEEDIQ